MDFSVVSSKRKSSASAAAGAQGTEQWTGGGKLSMYQVPPAGEVELEEFEQFALDRLRVLKGIEDARSRGKRPEEVEAVVNDLWRKHMRTPVASNMARKDVISHFVLRLVYCGTEDLRRWFLSQESTLFRHRFRAETPDAQKRLLRDSQLPYEAIPSAEVDANRKQLEQVARSINAPLPSADAAYYKVPFEEVPELVAGRKVYLSKGWAYVPRDQIAALVVGHFRARLSKALVLTSRHWTSKLALEERDRLTPVVEALSTRYLGPDYSQPSAKGTVSLQDIDTLAQRSFPLCMRHLHAKLKEDHHLRHGGRQQLGLFLKGIGLRLEDALAFWRAEFSQKIGTEKFDKEYSYNVRHNYGKEGKRTDYTPYSCMKIITSTPGVGDHHGCPLRQFSEDNLRAALQGMRLSNQAVGQVLDKVKSSHYQLACAATFEGVHGCACETGINHPNQYFEESRKVLEGDKEKGSQDTQGGQSTPAPTPYHRSALDLTSPIPPMGPLA